MNTTKRSKRKSSAKLIKKCRLMLLNDGVESTKLISTNLAPEIKLLL